MKVLLIDDLRQFDGERIKTMYYRWSPGDTIKIARSFKQGIDMLKNRGPWDLLLLDHDLGKKEGKPEKNGYHIMCWLEEYTQYLPKDIKIVSDNPTGRKNMQVVINKLYGRD